MSYDTWLDGTLALDPFPGEEAARALRVGLSAPRNPEAGRLVLTPLGHGLACEDAVDWESALDALQDARATILKPAGFELVGVLRALGEDGAHLATIFVNAGGVRVEHHEAERDLDVENWLIALRADDPELRREAASALAESKMASVVDALAAVAQSDAVEAVRCQALESLGNIGEDAALALATMVACLEDVSPLVRYWATFALGRLGVRAAGALPALERVATDPSDGPRFGAIDAIRRIRAAS
jgi:uncharacterized protein (UPF0147 family)